MIFFLFLLTSSTFSIFVLDEEKKNRFLYLITSNHLVPLNSKLSFPLLASPFSKYRRLDQSTIESINKKITCQQFNSFRFESQMRKGGRRRRKKTNEQFTRSSIRFYYSFIRLIYKTPLI
jgi:hypothetical protein